MIWSCKVSGSCPEYVRQHSVPLTLTLVLVLYNCVFGSLFHHRPVPATPGLPHSLHDNQGPHQQSRREQLLSQLGHSGASLHCFDIVD